MITTSPALSAQIFEAQPTWDDTGLWTNKHRGGTYDREALARHPQPDGSMVPLYHLEFLLTRLPKKIEDCWLAIIHKDVPKDTAAADIWTAGYTNGTGWLSNFQAKTATEAVGLLAYALTKLGTI